VAGRARPDSVLRRISDVALAVVLSVITSPFLLIVALAVRLSSRGPVLFSQKRVGRGEVEFDILKFRTMVAGAAGPSVSGSADPRVTGVGRVLRKTKLDELPQLWNILRGEMTFVGPRPEVPEMIVHYTPEERTILQHRPGIIGPGQLFYATDQAHLLDEAEDPDAFYAERLLHPKLAKDLEYLANRRLRTDLAVTWQTLRYAVASLFGGE
jgi:lipopolysaccharide/colanic/teichoic acid biosynthesis glycosyltransferase